MSMIHINGTSDSQLSLVDSDQIQPNATDVRLDKVFKVNDGMMILEDNYKQHRSTIEVKPDIQGYWILQPGTYEVVMEGTVTIAEGEAGWIITRSTLNRNGIFITSGLYDSGYSGVMAGAMHVGVGPLKIKQGTRVGQFLLFNSETLHKYNGSYGTTSEHDKKYK